MNNSKFLTLLLIVLATFFGVILTIALVIFILKIFSIVVIQIPGFTDFYGYVMLIIPYGIFLTTYFFLRTKIALVASKISKYLGTFFFMAGLFFCIFSLIIATINFIKVRNNTTLSFEELSHYFLVIQLGFIFIITMTFGLGDAKEKDWMERRN